MTAKVRSHKPTVLGLLFEGTDPSAALLQDGKIVAFVEEERLIREKHAVRRFPINAANYCLNEAGIQITDVDYIAGGWDASKFPAYMAEFYLGTWYRHQPCAEHVLNWQVRNLTRYTEENLHQQISENLFDGIPPERQPEIRHVEHHFAHACSAFMLSGFDEAGIITADGHGEDDCTNLWVAEGHDIERIGGWKLPASLGWFYTKFTAWFGFRPHDGEGKLMGLAAYGHEATELFDKVNEVIRLTDEEEIYRVNPRFFFDDYVESGPFTREWIEMFGEPRPIESSEPFSQYHKDLAYAVQDTLESIGLALMEKVIRITGKSKICAAGGTFMNCKMNGVLAKKVGLENLFVQPVAGDNGVSLGAALAVYQQLGLKWDEPMNHLYYGPAYSNDEIEAELKSSGLKFRKSDDLEKETAQLLFECKVIGFFQGRMEAGARALGNRSILANPLNPKMRDIVNEKVKFRESWRPFCPSTIPGEGEKYFNYQGSLPYMIVACDARKKVREKLPSVVHVDNTVRVHSVDKAVNSRLHKLIEEFKKISGYGVLLNTSFNIKGEPIVCSPKDAITCFLKTGMDILVIGDYVVTK